MQKENTGIALIIPLIMILISTGCGRSPTNGQSGDSMSGTIAVSGAWALYPLMVRWGEEFQQLYPDVRFDISAGGAGKGMADVLADAVDIGMVSREIYPEEIERGAFWVSVTKDAVFLTVNEANPVWEDLYRQGVTRETLTGIYITGEITTWGQLVGRPEVTESIHVFTRSDAAGAPATWAKFLGKSQEDLLGVGVYGDPGVLEAVIRDPLSIGYNNLNFAFDFDTNRPPAGARIVPLDVNGNGRVDPEEMYDTKEQAVNAVARGHYPSPPARDLNLVTSGKPTGLLHAFLIWVITDGQEYVNEVGYVALSENKLNRELEKLD